MEKTQTEEEQGWNKLVYNLGRRDATAQILMMARDMPANKLLRELATELMNVIPDHPHATWVLENIKD